MEKLNNKEEIREALEKEFGDCIIKEEIEKDLDRDIYVFSIDNLQEENSKKDYVDYLSCINTFNLGISLDFHVRNSR